MARMVGALLPDVPQTLSDSLGITNISNRYWFWLGRSRDWFYKLAPSGSSGSQRVRSEAAILGRLRHPSVARGQLVETPEWEILKVEAIGGHPLANVRDDLGTDEKFRIIEDLDETLSYVNGEGILHTDISPTNVLWDGRRAHLIDFEDARRLRSPIRREDSPDFIGGPPCCWGDLGPGYRTYLCLQSLREWLLQSEFESLKHDIGRSGVWNPSSMGNTCYPWSTRDDGSVYQSIAFGNEVIVGQREPELRLQYLAATKRISFTHASVLDIGCNFGRLGALLDRLKIARYVGVDLNPEYVRLAGEIARLEGRRKSSFVAGDVCRDETFDTLTGLAPAGYDIVICQSVYHHLPDKAKFWDCFARLGCRWFIFEGPVDDSRCLLKESWAAEKDFIRGIGYELIHEARDTNDFGRRAVALFETTGDHRRGR
jgi:SAM-dependent methyltransferase